MHNRYRVTLRQLAEAPPAGFHFVLCAVLRKRVVRPQPPARRPELRLVVGDETATLGAVVRVDPLGFDRALAVGAVLKIERPALRTADADGALVPELLVAGAPTALSLYAGADPLVGPPRLPPPTCARFRDLVPAAGHATFVCAVKIVFAAKDVATRHGPTRRRSVVVTDAEGADLCVTFWGADAALPDAFAPRATLLHLARVRVGEYRGRVDATYAFESLLAVDPPGPAADALRAALPALRRGWADDALGVPPPDAAALDVYRVAQLPPLLARGTTEARGRLVGVLTRVEADLARSLAFFCAACRAYCPDGAACAACGGEPAPSLKVFVDIVDESGCLAKVPLRGAAALGLLGIPHDGAAPGLPVARIRAAMGSPDFQDALAARHLYRRHALAFRVYNRKMSALWIGLVADWGKPRFLALSVTEP